MGTAGKILFPIPDRGLAERLYRIRARTQIIWGESDRLIPPVYAQHFVDGIAGAKLTMIGDAGAHGAVRTDRCRAGGHREAAQLS